MRDINQSMRKARHFPAEHSFRLDRVHFDVEQIGRDVANLLDEAASVRYRFIFPLPLRQALPLNKLLHGIDHEFEVVPEYLL